MTAMLTTTHTPADSRPPRMEPLARLPVFFALEGRRAVVAGGTPGAAWKAELLSATGAEVSVYAPEPCDAIIVLVINPPRGAVTIHRRTWQPHDIAGAAVAVGACESDDEARRFSDAARAAQRIPHFAIPPCSWGTCSPTGRATPFPWRRPSEIRNGSSSSRKRTGAPA